MVGSSGGRSKLLLQEFQAPLLVKSPSCLRLSGKPNENMEKKHIPQIWYLAWHRAWAVNIMISSLDRGITLDPFFEKCCESEVLNWFTFTTFIVVPAKHLLIFMLLYILAWIKW